MMNPHHRSNTMTDLAMSVERQALRDQLQSQMIDDAHRALKAGSDVLIRAPTGLGKTTIFNQLARRIVSETTDASILIVSDRRKVVRQNRMASAASGAETSLSSHGALDQSGQIVYGTAATIAANLHRLKNYSSIIIDECHHASADENSMHAAIIGAAVRNNPDTKIVGASATIRRADGQKLHPRLEGATVIQACYADGYDTGAIVKPSTIEPTIVGGKRSIADIVDDHVDPNDPQKDRSGLQAIIRRERPDDYFEQAADAWLKNGQNRPTFAFCDTIKEAEVLHQAFSDRGVATDIIHSGIASKAIEERFDAFESKRTRVLVSVDMLSEGVDIANVSCILNAKSTTTQPEYQQIVGRGMRAHVETRSDGSVIRKTDCIVIECGASARLNGRMERVSDIDSYATKGPAATTWRPWTKVSETPQVLAIHDGSKTIFAVRESSTKDFRLFVKQEAMLPGRRIEGSRITPFSPARANAISLNILARDLISRRMPTIAALDSRTVDEGRRATTTLRRLCAESYAASKGAIGAFMNPVQHVHAQRSRMQQTVRAR
jgi:superfamily II DNA or RNA helicase